VGWAGHVSTCKSGEIIFRVNNDIDIFIITILKATCKINDIFQVYHMQLFIITKKY